MLFLGELVMTMPKITNRFERDIVNILSNTPVDNIFDVGANTGQSSKVFLDFFPKSDIYAFEPVSSTYDVLKKTTAGAKNVRTYNIALGASGSNQAMSCSGVSPQNRLLDHSMRYTSDLEVVKVVRGDDFCRDNGIDRISLLKIDTEGHDLKVLIGFVEMLRDNRIDLIQVEAGMSQDNELHVPFQEFFLFLKEFDYNLFAIYDQVLEFKLREPRIRRSNPAFISRHVVKNNVW